jgi:L-ribulose-5-phosphate 4-epimerase
MDQHEQTLRQQIAQCAALLFRAGVMSHSGHGNISARLPGTDHMLLGSIGLIGDLDAASLPIVNFGGEVITGSMPAVTREIVGMHACVYRQRADIFSVIHTHSPHVTAFAIANQPLPCAYEALLRFGLTQDVPVAAWAPRGSPESVNSIVAQLEQNPATLAVLLGNHGLLAFGRDPLAVAYLIIAMEEAAEMTLDAHSLGGVHPFPPGALEQERSHMARFGSA